MDFEQCKDCEFAFKAEIYDGLMQNDWEKKKFIYVKLLEANIRRGQELLKELGEENNGNPNK